MEKRSLCISIPTPHRANIPCFLNRKPFIPSACHWHPERECSSFFFFSFQIIKNNTSGKFLSLSACRRNRLLFCKWGPCYYMHLFCLLTQIPQDACFHKTCLSSLMGPSHISDTDYLASQPISWLISRRMWNCLTSLQMWRAPIWLNHTWCWPVASVPILKLCLPFLRKYSFQSPGLALLIVWSLNP